MKKIVPPRRQVKSPTAPNQRSLDRPTQREIFDKVPRTAAEEKVLKVIVPKSVVPISDVMVDLETLGRRAGCVVLSIGAVGFGPSGLGGEYYAVLSIRDQKDHGLDEDPETLAWWAKQSPEARRVLTQASDSKILLRDALLQFNAYLNQYTFSQVKLWGNGSDFDLAILINLYAVAGLEAPWKFWNHRCFRTLKNLYPSVKGEARTGTYHNALDDAKTQALHAIELVKQL